MSFMKAFVYSTSYSREIGKLKFIIEDYEKTLEYIKKYVIKSYDLTINVGPIEFEKTKLACSKKYFSLLYRKYKSEDEITRNHIVNELIGCNGTKKATEIAFKTRGVVYHLGGGYHHAAKFRWGGFDYLNDMVYAIEYMRNTYDIKRFLIIDLDVHFPDGSYDTYVRDPNVYLFSMHGWNIFPGRGWITDCGSGKAKFTKLNIPLPAGTTGSLYQTALKKFLPSFLKISNPEIVIYQAGVDVLYDDELGNLRLSLGDIYERDRYVYELVHETYQLPLVIVAGGGYSTNTYKARANTASVIACQRPLFEENIKISSTPYASKKFEKLMYELEKFFKKFKKEKESYLYINKPIS